MKNFEEDASPVDDKNIESLPANAVIYDIVYNPLRTALISKVYYLTALIVITLMVISISGCASEPEKQDAVTRLDDDGYLYYMDYTKDYYGSEVMNAMRKIGYIDPGCSVFCTHNIEGEPITCRNYDIAHRVSEEDPAITGLNIVLHCKPEGK
jgi:hypothetical protein